MTYFKFTEKERYELAVKLGGIRSMQERIDCIEQIIQERGDGWVRVEDRLPKDGQDCFFYYGSKYPIIGTYKKDSKLFMCMEGNELWSVKEDGITHWSPCPLPPKDK